VNWREILGRRPPALPPVRADQVSVWDVRATVPEKPPWWQFSDERPANYSDDDWAFWLANRPAVNARRLRAAVQTGTSLTVILFVIQAMRGPPAWAYLVYLVGFPLMAVVISTALLFFGRFTSGLSADPVRHELVAAKRLRDAMLADDDGASP
jgi:hypothetical protein